MPDTPATARDIAVGILDRTGGDIRLALPLGLGKAVHLVNTLTELVAETPSARLSILTALTLERPAMQGMAGRFLAPAADRLFGTYPELTYARRLREGTLPSNIEVSEFFFLAGRWLSNGAAQRHYIAANYTHARDVLLAWRPNVMLQLLAREDDRLSLSCNTDISVDLLAERRAGRQEFILAGEVHPELPFFGGAAEIPRTEVDHLFDGDPGYSLYSAPKRPVGLQEHAIGLHVARLVEDGGTLQIGIGAIGDAVAHALRLRHAGRAAEIQRACPFAHDAFDASGPFSNGLYAVTEMLVDGLLQLFEEGIIRREAQGAAIHAGFFVESRDFYRRLREMPPDRRAKIAMMPVSFTNSLYGDEPAKRDARVKARFVNAAMKATCLGGIVSDATSRGREVSGIGGQFNFIEQAFALDGARAIITLPATRRKKGRTHSNIVWDHPHESVPRPYRDVIVTEYGIADLRGKRDHEAVAAMIGIADSRFQDALAEKARAAGKLPPDWEVPLKHRANTPAALDRWLGAVGLPDFPFGTDFDETERRILPALSELSAAQGGWAAMAQLALDGLTRSRPDERDAMERMGLASPSGAREILEASLLRGALRRRKG